MKLPFCDRKRYELVSQWNSMAIEILTSGNKGAFCADTFMAGADNTLGAGSCERDRLFGYSDWVSFLITIDEDRSSSFFLRPDPIAEKAWIRKL